MKLAVYTKNVTPSDSVDFSNVNLRVIQDNYYIILPEGIFLIFDTASGEFPHAFTITDTREGTTLLHSDFGHLTTNRWYEKILDNRFYIESPLVVDIENGDILYKEEEGYCVEDVRHHVLSEWGL